MAFTLYERGKIEHRQATTDELRWQPDRKTVRATVPAGDLALKIRGYLSVPMEFRELKASLDDQLPAVLASLLAGLDELETRRRQRAIDAERAAEADRVRRKAKAYREAESALLDRLLGQAARHRQAEDLRAYITAADRSAPAKTEDDAAWREWALAQADAMDPLLDGSTPFDRLPPIEDWHWRGW